MTFISTRVSARGGVPSGYLCGHGIGRVVTRSLTSPVLGTYPSRCIALRRNGAASPPVVVVRATAAEPPESAATWGGSDADADADAARARYDTANSPLLRPWSLAFRGATLRFFPVEHTLNQVDIAEAIVREGPAVVVVETAMGLQHGLAWGNGYVISSMQDSRLMGDMMLAMLVNAGLALRTEALDKIQTNGDDPSSSSSRVAFSEAVLGSDLWRQLVSNPAAVTEQLVYIAAVAVGAKVVFGDRPKDITYRRLLGHCSSADLDTCYGALNAHNYRELLAGGMLQREYYDVDHDHHHHRIAERIMFAERDVLLAAACAVSAHEVGGDGDRNQGVVCVFGAYHGRGLKTILTTPDAEDYPISFWQDHVAGPLLQGPGGSFQDLLRGPILPYPMNPFVQLATSSTPTSSNTSLKQMPSEGGVEAGSPVDTTTSSSSSSSVLLTKDQAIVKRALAYAVVRLLCTQDVLDDLNFCLGEIKEEDLAEKFSWTAEIYGTCQMQLASLPKDFLPNVIQGWPKGKDMYEVLHDVRQLRPTQGGDGYDFQVLNDGLRCMHYFFEKPRSQQQQQQQQ